MAEYYNVTTTVGDAEIAKAIASNTKLNITHVAFGDGNGSVPTPSKARSSLVKEVHRQEVNKYERHETVASWIVIEAIIPASIGGFWVREIGLIADGKLISHGSHAPFEKVDVSEYRLKFTQDIRDGSVVEITLDESLIFASQAWVEENYIKRAEIVDNLITNDIKKPLSAAQGKKLYDSKLDKTDNAVSSTKLQTARTIGGVGFDGTANINLPGVNIAGSQNTSGNASTATKLQTARTIGGVSFDGTANINLPGVNMAGSQNTSGNAATATKLQTARTINGISFDGSQSITLEDNKKLPLTGGTLTGEIIINTGESSPIKSVINKAGSIQVNGPTASAAIIHGLSFAWYQSEWQIGNVRSDSWASEGFGITNTNSDLRFLVHQSGAKNFGTLDSTGDITAPTIKISGDIKCTKAEVQIHNKSGRYIYCNTQNWGCYDPSDPIGQVPLPIMNGGTGNNFGIAPLAIKLNIPRAINGVNFDGSQNITIEDNTKFKAEGATSSSGEYPVWNAKSGVYVKNNSDSSSLVAHFLGTGSCPSLQILSAYSNGGLWYRSSRDSMGFEKIFDRIVTESGGVATAASKLQAARTIGGVGFDGTANINLPGVNMAGSQNTSGNAASATKLANARNIALSGAVSGSANFDGSGNIVINTAYNSTRNLNENGYIIHPDGRVEQWGYIAGGADEQIYTVNFPITFPNQCSNIQVSRMRKYSTVSVADADGGALVLEGTITRSSFVVDHQRFNASSVGSLGGTMWRAIGY